MPTEIVSKLPSNCTLLVLSAIIMVWFGWLVESLICTFFISWSRGFIQNLLPCKSLRLKHLRAPRPPKWFIINNLILYIRTLHYTYIELHNNKNSFNLSYPIVFLSSYSWLITRALTESDLGRIFCKSTQLKSLSVNRLYTIRMICASSAPTTTRVSVPLFGAFEFVFGAFAFANSALFRAESFANTEPGPTGLEPATFAVTGRRSNQLSYDSKKSIQSGANSQNRTDDTAFAEPRLTTWLCWHNKITYT